MATIQHVTHEDDIDGGPAAETVHFKLDGVDYEIDLSAENAAELRDLLRQYIEVAHRTGGRAMARRTLSAEGRRVAVPVTTPPTDEGAKEKAKLIRKWAKEQGIVVHPIGRISKPVIKAYDEAHAEPAPKRGSAGRGR